MKKKLIRDTFPKISQQVVRGETLFMVDARKTGTTGKREYFTKQDEAEKRAEAIAKDYAATGAEGLALPADLQLLYRHWCDVHPRRFSYSRYEQLQKQAVMVAQS